MQKKSHLFYVLATLTFLFVLISSTYANKMEYGNLVLGLNNEKMKEEKINPVIYPHWVHRMFFRCKVCHEGIEKMENGGNKITMDIIAKGEMCGKCHNDKISFGIGKENCVRCHSLSGEEAELTLKTDKMTQKLYPSLFTTNVSEEKFKRPVKFLDPYSVPMEDYEKVAERIGAKWNTAALGGKGFPKDKFGLIDFVKLIDSGLVTPITSLDPNEKEEDPKDNIVYFEVLSDFVDGIPFNHKTHSAWLKCQEPCHNRLFVAEAGGNLVHMRELSEGKYCGFCHGRVAFHLADCLRCHNTPKDKVSSLKGEVIRRINPLKGKGMTITSGGDLVVGKKGEVGPSYEKTLDAVPIIVPKSGENKFHSKLGGTPGQPSAQKPSEEKPAQIYRPTPPPEPKKEEPPVVATKHVAPPAEKIPAPVIEKIPQAPPALSAKKESPEKEEVIAPSTAPKEDSGDEELDSSPPVKGKFCLFF